MQNKRTSFYSHSFYSKYCTEILIKTCHFPNNGANLLPCYHAPLSEGNNATSNTEQKGILRDQEHKTIGTIGFEKGEQTAFQTLGQVQTVIPLQLVSDPIEQNQLLEISLQTRLVHTSK